MESARPIQIITNRSHTFELHPRDLKSILDRDDIKDRKVVIVSVAGAFRKGKSFLLNFFLKYLYAQYKTHDISDWIGERRTVTELQGFKSRGGPERETTGIWMWSDIFTHDFDNGNGDKVAIIIMDTQGIFDEKSTVRDCTKIFTISMMMSSVQCYNVMQNIQEDDLQNLQFFTEYGRLVTSRSNEKPFQKILFIVRDWFYAKQYSFGNGQAFIDRKMGDNNEQTPEMRQLRDRIRESFTSIGAFLMPYPGSVVAQGDFNGNLQQVEATFIATVKELVPSLFAPENLTIKTINGQKLRACDLVTYLESYVNILNSDAMPEPKTIFKATAEANNQILHTECLKRYSDSMEHSLDSIPFFEDSELQKTHNEAKAASLFQFQEERKLGDDKLIQSFQNKLETEIELKFKSLGKINDRQKADYMAKKAAEEEAARQARLKEEAEAEAEARRQAQLKAQADERAKIAKEEEDKANAEATRQAQLRVEAEAKAVAAEEAKKEAELEAAHQAHLMNLAGERAKAAEEENIRLMNRNNQLANALQNQNEGRSTLGKVLSSIGTIWTGGLVAGPVGVATGVAAAGKIVDE